MFEPQRTPPYPSLAYPHRIRGNIDDACLVQPYEEFAVFRIQRPPRKLVVRTNRCLPGWQNRHLKRRYFSAGLAFSPFLPQLFALSRNIVAAHHGTIGSSHRRRPHAPPSTHRSIRSKQEWFGVGKAPLDAQWLELTRRDPEAGTVERMGAR